MITKVHCKALKGLEFSDSLGRLNLFLGPNGIGKSARSNAPTLAILGYMPGIAKKNSEILDTYGDGHKLFVGFETDDKTHFLRRWVRDEDGSVSETFMVDRRGCNKLKYYQAMGGLRIFDLKAFMDLSKEKKIDFIFEIFPPAGDLGELETKIEGAKTKRNKYQDRLKTLEATSALLKNSRAAINLPAGTLAETKGLISSTEQALAEARSALEAARIEAARVEAEEAARVKAIEERAAIKEEVRAEVQSDSWAAQQEAQGSDFDEVVSDPIPAMRDVREGGVNLRSKPFSEAPSFKSSISGLSPVAKMAVSETLDTATEFWLESLRTILSTMQRTGCSSCAAALICKREIRKLQKGVAA